jgi:tripartite-type tricarboxylate transporter receptor subunit TctC
MVAASSWHRCVCAIVFALAFGAVNTPAVAEYPEKPIYAISTAAAGGGSDAIVRFFARKLSEAIGKEVIVENRNGAQGNIGVEYVARAKPDGYTILISQSSATSAAKYIFKSLKYDPIKDFSVVTSLIEVPIVLSVSPKLPVNSIAELTEFIKTKGNKTYGTTTHALTAAAEMYSKAAGLGLTKVEYKNVANILGDLASGGIDFAFLGATYPVEQAKAGRLKLLAVAGQSRSTILPDLPTMVESGFPGAVVSGWWAVQVPAATPKPIVEKLEAAFNQIIAQPDTIKYLAATLAADVLPGNAASATKKMKEDVDQWAEYAKLSGIVPQ